ncbi:DUF2544 domain-containing protein [Escherichia coli]|uniref:DUF2544 domain-containing protein n=2 Tax=Escherichia coli TaxID=562 RepID=A0A400AYA2_ECOLX|nr:StfH/YfcO family fimbrial adhesin [Escherichia coli]EFE2123231.1 DUF2544 domain-containing protein [Escherichia coli O74:H8]EFX7249358.1 DUF2544 domain-containing protein [Shigella sonnei]EAC1197092.1 DUF2544 domain-containing protein [Escherichia coli]EAC1833289.1 DUF2544 domain-containing protein [Escherichia coli]EEV7621588.1 DUF2544 domain-containing protein [Escherichia coli]
MKIKMFLAGILLFGLNSSVQADVTFNNIETYVASYGSGLRTSMVFTVDVLTPHGAYQGTYSQGGGSTTAGDVPNLSWGGPGDPPKVTIPQGRSPIVDDAYCPGMTAGWTCHRLPVNIQVTGTTSGCPWLVSTSIFSTAHPYEYNYQGPKAIQSNCPRESLENYDISWNENYVLRNKTINLKSTGGIVEASLPTFLMKDGKLCDGSNFDERGAYCRFVVQQITFSTSGCDNAKVTVTPEQKPITSKQLHDMKIRVDTISQQPIDSTCRFTYILNMY